jgi:hypothetical protein
MVQTIQARDISLYELEEKFGLQLVTNADFFTELTDNLSLLIEELNGKAKDGNSEIGAAIRRLYDDILLPLPDPNGERPVRLETIDLQSQLNTSQNLQERVLDALKNHVFDSITPAKLIRLSGLEKPENEYFEVLQTLSDKADGMTIRIEVQANTQDKFDLNWIRNAIEEPLDEMDIQASTRLE